MTTQFQGSEVWLIGYSLGGSLTLLPGLTYGLPVVAYEAPVERQAAKRLHLSGPSAVPYEQLSVWHIEQTADPIYMGLYNMETKCHVGKVCVFDVIEKLKWGISLKTQYQRGD
nr:15125_t:CDS:2 [Entrophospora candida]